MPNALHPPKKCLSRQSGESQTEVANAFDLNIANSSVVDKENFKDVAVAANNFITIPKIVIKLTSYELAGIHLPFDNCVVEMILVKNT